MKRTPKGCWPKERSLKERTSKERILKDIGLYNCDKCCGRYVVEAYCARSYPARRDDGDDIVWSCESVNGQDLENGKGRPLGTTY